MVSRLRSILLAGLAAGAAALGAFTSADLFAASCPPHNRHCTPSTSSTSTASTTTTTTTTTATTTTSTTTTTTPAAGYPASFYSGPAGAGNLLPPAGTHVWVGEETGNGQTQLASREAYFGRRFKIDAYYSQGRCDNWPSITADIVARGYIPMLSWFPPGGADQIIAGAEDACIVQFGKSVAAQSAPSFLRMYWEFNGGWMPFSKNADGTRATAAQQKAMWQHTVDVLRTTGALSKASIVWCPSEGYYNNGDAWNNPTPYPGDNYVDWVCSDGYNRFSSTAWCAARFGPPPTWCPFADVFTHGYHAPAYTPIGVEKDFRGRKPYMVGETGSVEDPSVPGRKGQWMLGMRDYIKSYMPDLYALVYFDLNFNGVAWNLDSSTSSLDGFKALMQDPYFGG